MKSSFKAFNKATMARAMVIDAPISVKTAVEIAKWLRNTMSDKATTRLEEVVALKRAVPFTRFTNGAGHRRGAMAAGKYPVKAAKVFLELIKAGVANAESKGLGTPLKIVHLVAQRASSPTHSGRQRSIEMKRTSLELVLMETVESTIHRKRTPKKKVEKKETEKKEVVKSDKNVESKVADKVKIVEKVSVDNQKVAVADKNEDKTLGKSDEKIVEKSVEKSAEKTITNSKDKKEESEKQKIETHKTATTSSESKITESESKKESAKQVTKDGS